MGEYRAGICSDQYALMLHCHPTPPIENLSRQWGQYTARKTCLIRLVKICFCCTRRYCSVGRTREGNLVATCNIYLSASYAATQLKTSLFSLSFLIPFHANDQTVSYNMPRHYVVVDLTGRV